LLNEIGERYSPPLLRAAGEKMQTKLTSQKSKLLLRFFFDNPTGDAFMYIM
jgi:hypothetical protein